MSCCAPGTEAALDLSSPGFGAPSREELLLARRDLGEDRYQTDLSVPGVHCGACIASIEQALRRLPAVEKARVNLSTRRVSIIWRDAGDVADPVAFVEAIRSATGYSAHLFSSDAEESDRLRMQLIRGVAVTGFASANIMLLSVSVWSGAEASTRDLFHWVSAFIAAPALIYGGRFFYRSAWQALRHGRTNMDVPIALAITLSYAVSLWETVHHGEHAWFDATVSLLFFLLIGRTLDHLMRDRARSAITGLARLAPRGALVLLDDGTREYRSVEEIIPGDRIAVAVGDRVPVDGTVISGTSDLDLSIVTGESAPQPVRSGAAVQAGVINLTGSLTLRATATVHQSFLAEVIALVEAAEGGRAQYRRIADRAATIYSPVVHLLALLTFVGWGVLGGDWKQAMLIAISVLIITCPCALGLAVPVVQVVAAGKLFQSGIMVKDGSAMERLAEADAIAFDKTGTLTVGRPVLIEAQGDPEFQALAAAIAAHSRHPLSRALAASHHGPQPAVDGVREIAGEGMAVNTPAGEVRLGRRAFACAGSTAPDAGGASEVVLAVDGEEKARFAFRDALRPDAKRVVQSLQQQGFPLSILSGDRRAAVRDTAERLGIGAWTADVSPQGKTDALERLRAAGRHVLMVGDGINDAPALSAAHVSMAPATAADIGRRAADFVFLREGLEPVQTAIAVSRNAARLIRENFALAVGYNIIAVPVAIAGYATPLVAAVAMSTSSLIVVVNALRLNRMARPTAKPVGTQGGAVTAAAEASLA
jgi:Cu2+-exporting ATPase